MPVIRPRALVVDSSGPFANDGWRASQLVSRDAMHKNVQHNDGSVIGQQLPDIVPE